MGGSVITIAVLLVGFYYIFKWAWYNWRKSDIKEEIKQKESIHDKANQVREFSKNSKGNYVDDKETIKSFVD